MPGDSRQFEIKVVTTADTNGAQETTAALKQTSDATGELDQRATNLNAASKALARSGLGEMSAGLRALVNPSTGLLFAASFAARELTKAIEEMNKASEETFARNADPTFLGALEARNTIMREGAQAFELWTSKANAAETATASLNAELARQNELLDLQNKSRGISSDSAEAIEAKRRAAIKAEVEAEDLQRTLPGEAGQKELAALEAEARLAQAKQTLEAVQKALPQQLATESELNQKKAEAEQALRDSGFPTNDWRRAIQEGQLAEASRAAAGATSVVESSRTSIAQSRSIIESGDAPRARAEAEAAKAAVIENTKAVKDLQETVRKLTEQSFFAKPNTELKPALDKIAVTQEQLGPLIQAAVRAFQSVQGGHDARRPIL